MYDKHFLSKNLNISFNDRKASKESNRPKMFFKKFSKQFLNLYQFFYDKHFFHRHLI